MLVQAADGVEYLGYRLRVQDVEVERLRVDVLPLPAGPYRAIFSAALSACGFWKVVMVVILSGVGYLWKDRPYVGGRRVNRPGAALMKRDWSPLVSISRWIALYSVAAGVLPPGLDQ